MSMGKEQRARGTTMNAKRALVLGVTLTTLMSLAPLAYAADPPITEGECASGGGVVFTNVSGFLECDGGTFEGRLVA